MHERNLCSSSYSVIVTIVSYTTEVNLTCLGKRERKGRAFGGGIN